MRTQFWALLKDGKVAAHYTDKDAALWALDFYSDEWPNHKWELKNPASQRNKSESNIPGYDEDDENWKATHPHGEFSVY